jgi:glycosyltransferase involved in cell wall biosynthesis
VKILTALTYYHPHWTGLTRAAQRVAEGLAARGHQVTVLTSHFRRDLSHRETVNGVQVVRLPAPLRISRGMIMPSYPREAARLIRQHDVVQVHTPMLEAPLLTALAQRAGVRSVITHHGDLVMPATRWDQAVERIVTALLKGAFRQADRAVVYTQDYLDQSRFLHPFQAKCIPIAPPVTMVEPDIEAANRWRLALGLAEQNVIGFAGRFVEEKGFDYLFKAIPHILRAKPNTRFAYAGDRNAVYERFFERCRPLIDAVEPALVWLGLLLDRQQLANFYAMCDVLAVPSRSDTFNLAQVESMLCGTPVVMTDIPGGRIPVRLTGMGRLVPPRDEAALTDGLLDVLRNPTRFVVPRARIEAIFSHERAIGDYERVLTQFP